MLVAFEPVGDVARWKVIYGAFREAQIGDVVTYEELARRLDLDPDRDRHAIQMDARRASKELSEVELRSTEAIRGKGYRIVEPKEQLRLADGQRRRAGRALKRGQREVVNVDYNHVDKATRNLFEAAAHAFAAQLDFNRRLERRTNNLETAMGAAMRESKATSEDMHRLQERLLEFEQRFEQLEQRDKNN